MAKNKLKGPQGGTYAWVLWGVASFFYLFEYFLRVAPSVMVHELMVHYQINATAMGVLAACYYYAYSPMQVVVGVMLDRFGGKKVLPTAALLAALGAFLFQLTSSFAVAALGRILMGMGSAFAFVGALYVASNWFPPSRFAMLSGLTTMLGMLGAFAGQGPTAYLVAHSGWQWSWLGAALVGLVMALVLILVIPKKPPWALAKRPESVLRNLSKILKNPQTWIIGGYGGFIYVPTSTFAALWGVPFLKTTYGLNQVHAATAVSLIFLGWILGAPLAGWVSDRVGRRKPMMIFSSLGVLLFSLGLIYLPGLSILPIYFLLLGIGIFSGGQVVCFASAYEVNPPEAKGSALAMTNMLVMITGALLQPLVGWFLDSRYPGQHKIGMTHFTAADFHYALWVVPAAVLVAFFFALGIKETGRH